MIFLQLWWTLMLLSGSSTLSMQSDETVVPHDNDKLKLSEFHRAVKLARPELKDLKSSFGMLKSAEVFRQRRDTLDDMLASFAQEESDPDIDDNDKAVDAWFRDFQRGSNEAEQLVHKVKTNAAKQFISNYDKAMAKTELAKVKEKYKDRVSDGYETMMQSVNRSVNFEDAYSPTKTSTARYDSNVQTFENGIIPDGVYEQTLAQLNYPHLPKALNYAAVKNNLSHEANYKLSKIEQDASERAMKKSRYPGGLDKRSVDFNPMNEIKLKTSHRLMVKGMGPSLPSNSLADARRDQYINNMLKRREQFMASEQRDDDEMPYMPQYDSYTYIEPGYDYVRPQYEPMHRRTMPNMREYARAKRIAIAKNTTQVMQSVRVAESKQNTTDKPVELLGESTSAALVTIDGNLKGANTVPPQEKSSEELTTQNRLKEAVRDVKHSEKELSSQEQKSKNETTPSLADESKKPMSVDIKLEQPDSSGTPKEEKQPIKLKLQLDAVEQQKAKADAVVKLLAEEFLQKDRSKRHLRNGRWRWIQRQKRRNNLVKQRRKRSLEEQFARESRHIPLMDDFEDHNGNPRRYGSLGNGLLIPNVESYVGDALDKLPYPRHQLQHYNDELESELAEARYDDVLQVPMLKNNKVMYQPGLGQQQASHKANFNLSNFLSEISKLQRMPLQQQQGPLPYQSPQQQAPNGSPNYGYQRYFGPLFNKANQLANQQHQVYRSNSFADPCVTISDAPGSTTTTATTGSTMNPDCIPIDNNSSSFTSSTKASTSASSSFTSPSSIIPSSTGFESSSTISRTIQSTPTSMDKSTSQSVPTSIGTTTHHTGPTTIMPPSNSNSNNTNICSNPDMMKMNLSINANVCGDPKTKQFYGNGTIKMQPGLKTNYHYLDLEPYNPYESEDLQQYGSYGEQLSGEERYARHLHKKVSDIESEADDFLAAPVNRENRSKLKNLKQAKIDKKPKKDEEPYTCDSAKDEACSDSFDKLVTGKVSEDIVRAVFDMVSNDASLERLSGVLEKNRKCLHKRPKNLYQIRNDGNEQRAQQTEHMIKETMSAISDIIDKQVRHRACIPLRPDLKEFYELIVKTAAEQDKRRAKRENNLRVLADDYIDDVHTLDASKIAQKTRIVKKLLRQYDELPVEDQQAVADIRDELLMDLIYLRKMAETAERNRRNAQMLELLKKTRSNPDEEQLSEGYSSRFLKLLKTAELYKDSNAQAQKPLEAVLI